MFAKLRTFFYTQIYINIVENSKTTTVYVEEVYYSGRTNNYEEKFDTQKQSEINAFISQMAKKSPLHYISVLDTSLSQGATPTCSSSEISQFCDLGSSSHICYTKQWGYYTSKLDVLEYQKRYAKVGIDYLFSPFLLLVNFFKDKVNEELSLYVLIDKENISLSVFNKSELLFAEQIDMDNQNEFHDDLLMSEDSNNDEELSLDEESINLEDVDVMDDMDALDDFDNIEDLDTFDEMDEFSEDEVGEIGDTVDSDIPLEEESSFGDDYHRFSLIQSAIKKFYMDDKFASDFVQKVYIADGVGISNELKKFLEEEMYLSVFVRKIDLCVELCEVAKAETK